MDYQSIESIDLLVRRDKGSLIFAPKATSQSSWFLPGPTDDTDWFFAEENGIAFHTVENADHRFMDPGKMTEAIQRIDAFFAL